MDFILDSIINYLDSVNATYVYLLLFVSAVVENIFPPAPGDTITAFGAFMVGTGRLEYLMVYLVTTAGSTAGFMILYFLGRFLDRNYFFEKKIAHFDSKTIDIAIDKFNRYGYIIVLINRFLPGVRSVISISAGIVRLKPHLVFVFATSSALIWNLIWIQAGFLLGDNWDTVKQKITVLLGNYNKVAVLLIILALAYFFLKNLLVNSKK